VVSNDNDLDFWNSRFNLVSYLFLSVPYLLKCTLHNMLYNLKSLGVKESREMECLSNGRCSIIFCFFKGTVSNVHSKFLALKQHLAFHGAGPFSTEGFFRLPTRKYNYETKILWSISFIIKVILMPLSLCVPT